MSRSSPWLKLLPPLGVLLAGVLVAAAGAVWWSQSPAPRGSSSVGDVVATAQAARVEARAVLAGETSGFAALRAARERMSALRSDAGAADAFSHDRAWSMLDSSLDRFLDTERDLGEVAAARSRLLELAPQILAATADLTSALSAADRQANQALLARLEFTVDGMQQSLQSLGLVGGGAAIVERLAVAGQYFEQLVRGLRGEDQSLGATPITGESARQSLADAALLLEEARAEIGRISANSERLVVAETAVAELDTAAAALLDRYAAMQPAATVSVASSWPLILVGAALVIVLLMMFAYYQARDFRRAAQIQAEQNERNQQAILRLLDELSSLADGDLTVQATVTEDITGAIADSINYAIEALRELVATVNESAILVDAAAKQTEASSRQLVRSSEVQAKQAAAASESMARMAASIEEVSGNAERCSDVARHAVELAHKGGEAVRRTIAGMNAIRETIQDTSKRIKRLGESSQEIGNIVELIEEIAEQTNILALNASIEASRAGEASRGFAVVADEVQKLAERSANATKKIEVLVSTIQSDTNEAVVSMERSTTDVVGGALLAENAGAALDEIEQVSHQIASLVHNISSSSREQANVASAITKNMQVLREISSRATASTAATSDAISKLSELASQLRRTVAGFTLPNQGSDSGALKQVRAAVGTQDEAAPEPAAVATVRERRRLSG